MLYEWITVPARHSLLRLHISHKMQRFFQLICEHDDVIFSTHLNHSLLSSLVAASPSDQVHHITVNITLTITLAKVANLFLIPESLSYWSFSETTDKYPIFA